jgi:diadenosine tetraphosphate (Ap4A) HIT family hydrolase
MCESLDRGDKPDGVRILNGRWSDGYLGRFPVRPGYCYVIWKGRHVAEPTQLSAQDAAGFWSEASRVASAVEYYFQPATMNWLVLGNGVPHLHVHLVPRPVDDPHAGGPIETDAFDRARAQPLPEGILREQMLAMSQLVAASAGNRADLTCPNDGEGLVPASGMGWLDAGAIRTERVVVCVGCGHSFAVHHHGHLVGPIDPVPVEGAPGL